MNKLPGLSLPKPPVLSERDGGLARPRTALALLEANSVMPTFG